MVNVFSKSSLWFELQDDVPTNFQIYTTRQWLGTCRTYPKIKLPVSWANISLAELEESYDILWHRPALALIILVLPVGPAQGGGGSFKDRKPIGKVSCCDAWAAERTDGPKGGWGSESLCLSLLRHVLRATAACTFCRAYLATAFSRLLYLFGHLDLVSSDSFSFLTALATDCCCP